MFGKDELRKKMISLRDNISNKKELSKIISNKIIELDIYKKSQIICLYKAMANEVDTEYLIQYSLKNKKTVLLPRVSDNNLVFLKINNDTKFIKSKFKVLEPVNNPEDIYHGKIDLIICPGVCFDVFKNRMGYDKGYYDRFLQDKDIYKIGIGFNKQIMNKIPINNLDIKMNLVVTEKTII